MKVLYLGHCSFYTVSNLAKAIVENSDNVKIYAADLIKPGGGNITKEEMQTFENVIELPRRRNTKVSREDKRKEIFNIVREHSRRRILSKNIFLLRKSSLKNFVNNETKEKVFSIQMREKLKGYDVYNFHYISPEYLDPLKYIEEDKKIILSFWGSDLFQVIGEENYARQLEALERADYITINPGAMEEVLLSKFGRHLESKIRTTYFVLNWKKFNEIEKKKNSGSASRFRIKNQIPPDKKIICVGYSASAKQRHTEVLKILDKLDSSVSSKFHVVIPMTYGLQYEEKHYLSKVKQACSDVKFGTTILTEYMSSEDLIDFTLASDIKLNLRDTDALNASMVESLFAESIVVNGSWLPYEKLKRLGIFYREVDSLDEIAVLISELINDFDREKAKTKNNPDIIKDFFSPLNIVKDWTSIFTEIQTTLK